MGAQFDKWLARPSTLRFLRHLIEPDAPCARARTMICRDLPRRRLRPYSTATSAGVTYVPPESDETPNPAWEQEPSLAHLKRAAEELGLSLPKDVHTDSAANRRTSPVSNHFDVLRTQTNVQTASLRGSLLIDKSVNHANLHGWCQVLRFRERLDGINGVLDVWSGMRQRNVDLPVSGDEADILWSTFVHAAVVLNPSEAHSGLLQDLYAYAQRLWERTGQHYHGLHRLIVGRLLRVAPGAMREARESHVLWWHAELQQHGFCGPNAVRDLLEDTLLSDQPWSAFRRFKVMYCDSNERDLYDHCMPQVLKHNIRQPKAIVWHQMFLSKDDRPSEAYAAELAIQSFHHLDKERLPQISSNQSAVSSRVVPNALRAGTQHTQPPVLSRALMNSLVGDVHGIKPKTISDTLCARMLATQTFSFDFTLRGLAFLGAEELGPLSIRELAMRAEDLAVFRERISQVKDTGIRISDCMYTRIMQRLALQENAQLFRALLDSDQHPESYDDEHIQASLLDKFLHAEDWPQLHLTLLSLALADRVVAGSAWNRLLQYYAKERNYREAMQIVEYMHSIDCKIAIHSVKLIRLYLLPFRARGKRPQMRRGTLPRNVDSLDTVVNIHLRGAARGTRIWPNVWREMLKRYGMVYRMDRLERLAIALAQICAKPDSDSEEKRYRPKASDVFTPVMLQAIVVWGYRTASVRNLLRPLHRKALHRLYTRRFWRGMRGMRDCEPWTRGLLLLKRLRDLGIAVSDARVADALRLRLWILLGPAVSTLRINLEAIRRNQHDLRHYVEHANEVWGAPLLPIPAEAADDDVQLAIAIFGKVRSANQKTGDQVDVAAWAAARARDAYNKPSSTLRARHFNWKYSPIRFSDGLMPMERIIMRRQRRQALKEARKKSLGPT